MLTPLASLMKKELRQTFRDKRMVALLIMAPMFQLIVLGFAVNLDVVHIPTVVVDEDRTPASRALVAALTAGDTFDLVGHAESGEEATRIVQRGEAPVAVVVPRGYGEAMVRGTPVRVQALVDGGDSNRAIVAQNALVGFGLQRSLSIAVERVRLASAARGAPMSLAPLAVEPRILYNPTLDSHIYFVPGVAATLLLVVTLVVTAMGLAREKEMGTLEQVMVTPISPTALILGKTLPYAGLGMITLGLVVTAGAWIFSVPLRGELWIIAVAGLLYLMSTLGIGLFLSTIAKNQQQAFMGAFFVIMPAILLSGFMTPIQNMPAWLRPASAFNPVRHFVDVMRGVLLKGATFEELAPQLVAMAGIGTAVFLMSALMLHRSLR